MATTWRQLVVTAAAVGAIGGTLGAGAPPHSSATQQNVELSDEAERIQKAAKVLHELTATPDSQIPSYLLERAEAIMVIPSLIKGGFVIGAKHGEGIVSGRDRSSGTWSDPAFVEVTGGSIGWQIGAESVDLVLLVMNKNGLDQLLEDRFTIGGNTSVAAGPVGRSADAAINAQLSAEILAYSRAKGLFAGATLEGAAVHADNSAIKDFYGREYELETILTGDVTPANPSVVAEWKSTLAKAVGKPSTR